MRGFIEKSTFRDRLHAGIVLTGGTALLPGITDVAERILEMKCRRGSPAGLKGFAHVVNSPIYATGIGLIYYGMEIRERESRKRSGVRRILDYLDDTFA